VDIRIIADDLTGALDSAVCFASPGHGVGVSWQLDHALSGRLAVDIATREGAETTAGATDAPTHSAAMPATSATTRTLNFTSSRLVGDP